MEAAEFERCIETGQLLEGRESFGGLTQREFGSKNASYEVIPPTFACESGPAASRARGGFGTPPGQGSGTNEASPQNGRRGLGVIGRGDGRGDDSKSRM